MPYISNKPRATSAWLPSQVAYGIDMTDPDPERWVHFGRLAEQIEAEKAAASAPKKSSAAA